MASVFDIIFMTDARSHRKTVYFRTKFFNKDGEKYEF